MQKQPQTQTEKNDGALERALALLPILPRHHPALPQNGAAPPLPPPTPSPPKSASSAPPPSPLPASPALAITHNHHHHNSHYQFPELKDKCRSLIGCMGRSHTARRHSASADFKYDALSYALNFDHEEVNIEDYPFRSFSARLPPSTPRTSQDSAASPSTSKEITACS